MGQQLGKYVLTRKLGSGGMGEVWEGRDTALGRRVAIKLIRAGTTADPRRFQREASAAAQVHHPNTVTIFDIGTHDDRPFIVMELVEGANAGQLVDHRGALPWEAATRVLIGACKGLAAVHDAGFVHRDIKPTNLLISPSGVVKLADFGLAKAVGGATRSLTGEGTVGTPHYMSPEQCWNEGIDARTDIYALGATYFTLLTGRTPYDGDSGLTVMFAHCNGPVPDPRSVVPGIPDGCAEVIRKAMAKQPADRYQTPAELRAALDAMLGREGASADPTAELVPLGLPLKSSEGDSTAPPAGPAGATTTSMPPKVPRLTRRRLLVAGSGVGIAAAGAWVIWGRKPVLRRSTGTPGFTQGVWHAGGTVAEVAISKDGRWVAVAMTEVGDGTGGVRIIDRVNDGRARWHWNDCICRGVAISPDGKYLVVGIWAHRNPDGEPPQVRVLELGAGDWRQLEWGLTPPQGNVGAVAISPDGLIAAASYHNISPEGYVRIRKDASLPGYPTRNLMGGAARTLSFAGDSTTLATTVGQGAGGRVDLWNAPLSSRLKQIPAPAGDRGPLAAFAQERPVLVLADQGGIRFVAGPEFAPVGPTIQPAGEPGALAFSPSGLLLAAGVGPVIHLWDARTGKPRGTLSGHTGAVTSLAFTGDGRTLLSGGEDRTVRLWDLPPVEPV